MPVERLLISSAKRRHTGALAQLGERLLCTQEVRGSIPLGSTTFPEAVRTTASFRFRAHPGGSNPRGAKCPVGISRPSPEGEGLRIRAANTRIPLGFTTLVAAF